MSRVILWDTSSGIMSIELLSKNVISHEHSGKPRYVSEALKI